MNTPAYVCECPAPERRLYAVTSHTPPLSDGQTDVCAYCDDCAALAEIDWNGTTASIVRLGEPGDVYGVDPTDAERVVSFYKSGGRP